MSLLAILILIPLILYGMAYFSRAGAPPGLSEGKLVLCPDRPNCVCSEQASDTEHYVEPLDITPAAGLPATGSPAAGPVEIMKRLQKAVTTAGGDIRHVSPDYLSAEFRSAFFGFVDDLEFRVDAENGQVHVRSASRIGYGDMGINRKRVERLRKLLNPS